MNKFFKALSIGLVACMLFYASPVMARGGGHGSFNDALEEVKVDVKPDSDDTYSLGSATKEWKDLYLDGTLYADRACGAERHMPGSQNRGFYRRCYPLLQNDPVQNLCHADHQLRDQAGRL